VVVRSGGHVARDLSHAVERAVRERTSHLEDLMKPLNRWIPLAVMLAFVGLGGVALAQTTPGTGGTTAASTTGNAITITPAGNFTANGTSTLSALVASVTCNMTVTGNLQEDGTGTISVTYSNCVDSTGTPCTAAITSGTMVVTTTFWFTQTNSPSNRTAGSPPQTLITAKTPTAIVVSITSAETGVIAGARCTVVCTVSITATTVGDTSVTATIVAGDDPSLSLSGTVRSTTFTCNNAGLSGSATITATSPNKGTGNDVTITT
jgi:hypothetical protein